MLPYMTRLRPCFITIFPSVNFLDIICPAHGPPYAGYFAPNVEFYHDEAWS